MQRKRPGEVVDEDKGDCKIDDNNNEVQITLAEIVDAVMELARE